MAGRNRGRANPNQDADEERRLWKEIKDKSKEVDGMVARSNSLGNLILAAESELADSKSPNPTLDERLEKLYRENLKLCEEVTHIIEGKSNDTNLLDSLKILAGLREASEESLAAAAPHPRSGAGAGGGKLRGVGKKGGASAKGAAAAAAPSLSTAEAEIAEEAPSAPSPRINLSSRLNAKDKPSRAASVSATTREASVKLEADGAESVASSADGVAPSTATTTTASKNSSGGGHTRPTNRLVLTKGEIVFCRHSLPSTTTSSTTSSTPSTIKPPAADTPEGEGILCRVTAVIGEGKQRRYEVQDADPTTSSPPPPQRASVSQLIQIPATNKGLGGLERGRGVLAQYPDTTTFYRAEVMEKWEGKGGGEGGLVRLRFEDDEGDKGVERRFVLTEK